MSAPRVVIVGSGLAALAAAFAASRGGAEVTLVSGGVGASALYAGAVDDVPWDELERSAEISGAPLEARPLPAELRGFAEALDLWRVAADGAPAPRLATTAGITRSSRAHDRALLDLCACRGRTVLVPRAERAGWDADSLVRCLRGAVGPADEIELAAIGAPVLRFDEERDIVDVDLAARHDDDARLAWLASTLEPEVERRGRASVALLLGPWLGASRSRADALSARLGVPVGEALSATSGTAGARFERARDALLDKLGARVVAGWVTRVEGGAAKPRVVLRAGEPLACDVVVLATGGLIGGRCSLRPARIRRAGGGRQGREAAADVEPRGRGRAPLVRGVTTAPRRPRRGRFSMRGPGHEAPKTARSSAAAFGSTSEGTSRRRCSLRATSSSAADAPC
jgi:glycerol-3-phosphate dehydrogenase subunit B